MQLGLIFCLLSVVALGVQARPNEQHHHNHDNSLLPANIVSPHFDIIQSLSDFVDKIARSLMERADTLGSQVIAIFEPIMPELFSTLDNGNNALEALSEEFEVDAKHRALGACIDEYVATVRAILSNGKEEVRQCVQTAADQVAELRAQLETSVAAIKEEVQEIKSIVAICKKSGEVARCILENLKQLLTSAAKIVVETVSAAIETRVAVQAILVENQQCVVTAVVKARKAVLEARLDAIECASAGTAGSSTKSVLV